MIQNKNQSASKVEAVSDFNIYERSLKKKSFNLNSRKQSHQKLDCLNVDVKLPHIFLQENNRKKHQGPVLHKVKACAHTNLNSRKNVRHMRVCSEPDPDVTAAEKFC